MHRIFFALTAGLLVGLSCCKRSYTPIKIRGSDSEVNVVQALAEAYMDKTPGVSIAVTGGGSGTGIASLIDNKTDVANASRDLTPKEIELFQQRGIAPQAFVFAIDALAIVVHPSCPLDTLNLEDLGRLFRGELANWTALGGPDRSVSLYGRQSSSGTYLYFRDRVLKADYAPKLIGLNGTAQIVEAVQADPGGIGYVSAGYLGTIGQRPGVKVLFISEKAGARAVSPLDEAKVLSGDYPIARPLYQFTAGTPNPAVQLFLAYEKSPEGQLILRKNGFIPK